MHFDFALLLFVCIRTSAFKYFHWSHVQLACRPAQFPGSYDTPKLRHFVESVCKKSSAGDFITTADGKKGFIKVVDERYLLVTYVELGSAAIAKIPLYLLRSFKDVVAPDSLGFTFHSLSSPGGFADHVRINYVQGYSS